MIMAQENAILKARVEFQRIEDALREVAAKGERIDVVEEDLWQRMRRLGRLLLSSFVAGQGTGDLGPTLEYEGRVLRRLPELHAKPYMSIFGSLPPIQRTVYGTRETQKHEVIPLDARLGLPEGEYSYVLQTWSQGFCVKNAYQSSQADLEQILGLRPSIRVLEDMNGSMAADVPAFRSSQPTPRRTEEGEILVMTADGKGVRIRGERPADDQRSRHSRKRGPKPGTKREACVGSVYTIAPFVRTADEVVDEVMRQERAADRPTPQDKVLRAEMTREIDGVARTGKDMIFDWFGEQVLARRREPCQEVVCVMDGAPSLWQKARALKSRLGVLIVCILDIFHVLEYLWEAARCVHPGDDQAAEAFVNHRLRRILQGDVGRVIGGLRQMLTKREFSQAQRESLQKVIGYLHRKRKFMRYDEYLAKGYPIGSGVAEGACGHVIKDRMEGTGMRWCIPSAQSMLDLRCVYLNDQWHAFQDHRIKHRVDKMYPYRDLTEQQYRATG